MGQLTAVRTELKGDIAEVSAAASVSLNQLSSDGAGMRAALRNQIDLSGRRLLVRITVLLVVLAAAVFTALRYLPLVLPH